MDSIHFLNIEYILLRLQIIFTNILEWFFSFFTGTPPSVIETEGINSPTVAYHVSESISFTGGQLALLGMALAIIFLALAVYIRIKLEIIEHEGFHAREAKYHGHGQAHAAAHGAEETHEAAPHNARWEEVKHLASGSSESDWRRAVMEADILLGEALKAQGYRGNTVGELLKDANPLQMHTLDIAWQAHKVRNEIAHGGEGYHLSEWDAKATIDFYRRVFEELGFI